MARIPTLLEMFPEARFVHIVRNPYPVYQSMRNMYRKTMPGSVLQKFEWEAIDQWVVEAYCGQVKKFLEDRKAIPEGRLIEIQFEKLEISPLPCLERIYGALELGDFSGVRPLFEAYLESLGEYKKNEFEFPPDVIETVNRNWAFAFEAFGYEMIESGQAEQPSRSGDKP